MLQQTVVNAVHTPISPVSSADFLPLRRLLPRRRVMCSRPGPASVTTRVPRNLHACAQQVVALGGFPQTVEELRALPGIGAYTAVAIAAIAFGVPGVPMDAMWSGSARASSPSPRLCRRAAT